VPKSAGRGRCQVSFVITLLLHWSGGKNKSVFCICSTNSGKSSSLKMYKVSEDFYQCIPLDFRIIDTGTVGVL